MYLFFFCPRTKNPDTKPVLESLFALILEKYSRHLLESSAVIVGRIKEMINSVIWLISSSLHDYFALFVYVPRSNLWSVGHVEPKAETYTMGDFGK